MTTLVIISASVLLYVHIWVCVRVYICAHVNINMLWMSVVFECVFVWMCIPLAPHTDFISDSHIPAGIPLVVWMTWVGGWVCIPLSRLASRTYLISGSQSHSHTVQQGPRLLSEWHEWEIIMAMDQPWLTAFKNKIWLLSIISCDGESVQIQLWRIVPVTWWQRQPFMCLNPFICILIRASRLLIIQLSRLRLSQMNEYNSIVIWRENWPQIYALLGEIMRHFNPKSRKRKTRTISLVLPGWSRSSTNTL